MTEAPVKIGQMLFTMVDPTRGHEVAYNRWYERDHFYAGCMLGAWTISGARFVATRDLKDLRAPDSTVAPDPLDGSYLSLYWIVAGKFGEKNVQLDPWQSVSLWHSCRAAKETLLAEGGPKTNPISVLGRGSKLIGGTVTVSARSSPGPADRSAA